MKPFNDWYAEIISDERWYETIQMGAGRNKDIKEACLKVYTDAAANNLDVKPIQEHRRHVANVLWKMPVKQIDWWKVENKPEEKKEESPPLTGEERQKRLAEWRKEVEALPQLERTGSLTKEYLEQNGQVRPAAPKGKVYPSLSAEEVYVRERHLAWLQHRYHPVTMDILPDTQEEEDFNIVYNQNYLKR